MDTEQGVWTDCEACDGTGEALVYLGDADYFPTTVGCRHCDGTGLGAWLGDDDDGDTRRHDAPYDFAGGRAAA